MALPFLRPKPGVRCDSCRRHFEPVPQEVASGDGGAIGQFTCPRCGALYESYTITPAGIVMRAALADARRRGDQGTIARLEPRLKEHVRRGRGRVITSAR